MATTKEIRRRIKSTSNTKQIIKAMELVSVVKMQKAVAANLASRTYYRAANSIVNNICCEIDHNDHPLFCNNENGKNLVVVMTSNRGLCGSLNSRVVKKLTEDFDVKNVDVISVGRKGRDLAKIFGANIIADFSDILDGLNFDNMYPIYQLIQDSFLEGKYESVSVVYPDFKSTLSQTAETITLLPLKTKDANPKTDKIIYEPGKSEVLETLVPRILITRIWQSLQETVASEHSARMVAMKNANENAAELIDDLTLTLNQTRQANITNELAEISAGKMALEE